MATYKTLSGQSFFDISIILFGTHERALELVAQTGLESVTDIPETGQVFTYEETPGFVTNCYKRNSIKPASSDYSGHETGGNGSEYDSTEYGNEFNL